MENFMKKKNAFTLAEVLITLGIIGVVAAMTLPALIGNYQKKQTATQLKKFYSVMQQAITRAEVDHGPVKGWDFRIGGNEHTEMFTDKYIKPYIKIIKEYLPEDFPEDIHYTCLKGGNCDHYGQAKENNPKLVFADGTMIIAADLVDSLPDPDTGTVHQAMNIIIDLNGFKRPNQYGRDVFAFSIQPEKRFVPAGVGYTSAVEGSTGFDRDWFLNGGNGRGCNKTQSGFYCAALIMIDGWEITDDYPW